MITGVWTKSSYSTAGGSCVEVRRSEEGDIQIRDSKNPNGPALTFASTEWTAFISGTKHDEFNL
jgi:hypothetical protein